MNEREEIINFLLQRCDQHRRIIEDLQKHNAELQKHNGEFQAQLAELAPKVATVVEEKIN